MGFVEIQDLNDARLDAYRDLPGKKAEPDASYFIAESRFVVRRLLASELATESILCSERSRHEFQDVVIARPEIPIFVVAYDRLQQIIGFKLHRGVLACGRRPPNLTVSDVVANDSQSQPLVVVCPQIADPANLAGVIRNCAAFGVRGLIVGRKSCAPYSRRVVRVSMGTLFRLRLSVSDNLQADLHALHEQFGYHRVATVLDPTADSIDGAHRPAKLALLLGGEGAGLDPTWVGISDQRVTLPMQHGTDSLNLATAAAVFLYHYCHVANSSDRTT